MFELPRHALPFTLAAALLSRNGRKRQRRGRFAPAALGRDRDAPDSAS